MSFQLTILGSSSATPTTDRHPTSQFLTIYERYFLIDCGEGAQMQMRKFKLHFGRINHIFISHLHGDHILGLPGFLATLHLTNRTNDLHIYCHAPLKEILELQYKYSETYLKYNIIYHFFNTEESEVLYEDDKVTVETIILNHRIPCCGFIFREKQRLLSVRKDKLAYYKIEPQDIPGIKRGNDYTTKEGKVILNIELTFAPRVPQSYAYCSDTIYSENIINQINGVSLLYHEATFLNDMLPRAKETYHTTALQAGTLASKANIKKLLIGHFSARYKDLQPLLDEAKSVFLNTELATEGTLFETE